MRLCVNSEQIPAITPSYADLNRLTGRVDDVGTTYYGYDAAGQLLSEDGPWNDDTVSYTYTNRLRASLSLLQPTSDPWSQTYAYDGARRLTNLVSPAGAFSYAYGAPASGPALLVSKLSLPNGAFITNTYDSVARLTGTFLKNSGNSILNSDYYFALMQNGLQIFGKDLNTTVGQMKDSAKQQCGASAIAAAGQPNQSD